MSDEQEILLSVRGLKKVFPIPGSAWLPKNRQVLHAVDGVDFDICRGETLGLVGESGCGKTTVGRMLVGIEQPTAGEVRYMGQSLVHAGRHTMVGLRTDLQMIFQDSYASLNPRKRVVDILSAPMLYHHLADRGNVEAKVDELLDMVGLPKNAKQRYPHEFSGGQRQRISIARALSLSPSLIVCDEPVSALDMSIQAQILNLLRDLQKDLGVTYLFIAHGLGAVHYVSSRIAVMYLGKIVEIGPAGEVFAHPRHPYTKALVAAVPLADPTARQWTDHVTAGEVPSAIDLPQGCRFAARCPHANARCRGAEPRLAQVPGSYGHQVACYYEEEEG